MFLKSFSDYLFESNYWITISSVLIVYYLVNFYRRYYSYPRGPFPLPVLGNVLHFRGGPHDKPPAYKMAEWAKKYGPIYTVWVSSSPLIVVNSHDVHNEASVVKRNEFINKTDTLLNEMFRGGSQNIFATSGPYWEALRKVGVFAIRKFQSGDKLAHIASEVMDEAIQLMLKAEQPINPILYIDFMIYNILAYTAYGERFGSIDDQLFRDAKKMNDDFYVVAGHGLISEFIPWLRPFYYRQEQRVRHTLKLSVDITKNKFLEHQKEFTPGIIRDFSDCVLEAKEEAIRENYSRNKYLNDNNLFMIVSDLFQAGTDTTQTTMRWALLFLANDPKLQQKLYEEINTNIGDRIPTPEDKDVLPQMHAFILEVLRFRPPVPVGLDHSNGADAVLGGYNLPKNSRLIFDIYSENNDPKYWTNPDQFDLERFIDSNGKVRTGRIPSFSTFGYGPRGCPGEKLAIFNLLLMLTRLLQSIRFTLPAGDYSADIKPVNILVGLFPKDYKIVCKSRHTVNSC